MLEFSYTNFTRMEKSMLITTAEAANPMPRCPRASSLSAPATVPPQPSMDLHNRSVNLHRKDKTPP